MDSCDEMARGHQRWKGMEWKGKGWSHVLTIYYVRRMMLWVQLQSQHQQMHVIFTASALCVDKSKNECLALFFI